LGCRIFYLDAYAWRVNFIKIIVRGNFYGILKYGNNLAWDGEIC